jgi:predicted XRE-type DNA-binding protein
MDDPICSFANPDREPLNAYLALQIYRIIKSRGLTEVEAGAILGFEQPYVSALIDNRYGNS